RLHEKPYNFAVPINEEGFRHAANSIVSRDFRPDVKAVRVCLLKFRDERPRLAFRIGVGHAKQHYTFVPVFLPGFLQFGRFCTAGAAPACPEVDDGDLPAQFFERVGFAVEGGEREWRRSALGGRGLSAPYELSAEDGRQ